MTRATRHLCLRSLIAPALLAVTAGTGAAQGTVTGQVRATNTQRPVAGAAVVIPGTNLGAVTNTDGRYLLRNVPAGVHRLRVEFIGYQVLEQTATVPAEGTVVVDFELQESAVPLDQIVVTGTAGQARKREVGNSLSSIAASEIELAPVRSMQDVINARATGVTVMANSGQPGSGGAIRLRGNNSIAMGNEPLVYVDGVRLFSRVAPAPGSARQGTLPINDINPEDIERIEIVKGAAATTLYGTEASGGVIQIFTKRGTAGAPVWSAEVSAGYNDLGQVGPEGDPTGLFLKKCRGPELVSSDGIRWEDPTCPPSGTWLRKGMVQRYSVSVRGGSQALTYYLSGSYNDEQGVIEGNFSRDGGFRGNFSFRPSNTLELAVNSAYTRRRIRWLPDGNLANGFTLNVMRGRNNNFKNAELCDDASVVCLANGEILEQELLNNNDHFVSGLTVRWEPNERWSHRFTVGYDYNVADNLTHLPFAFSRQPLGQILTQAWNHTTLSLDYVGSFRHELLGAASTFSWGGQLFEDRNRQTNVQGQNFSGPGNPTVTSGALRDVTFDQRLRVVNAGFFAQQVMGWNDRLFVTAGVRVDGNSAFGESFGLQLYPKISASYVLSDLAFWPSEWWETLKLRAAIGEAGKAPGAFDASRTWEPVAGDEGQPGFTPDQIGNPDLGPERTREIEVGFESSAFQGRLGAEFTFYHQRTIDALVQVRYPPSQGFANRQLENIGELENKGIELQLDGGVIVTPTVDWRVRLSLSTNETKAIDLGGEAVSIGLESWAKEGRPVPAIYGVKILNPNEYADPVVTPTDTFIGPIYPTRTIAVGTTLTLFNRVTLDILGEHQGGHYLQNWTGYQNANRFVWYPCYEAQQALRAAQDGDASKLAKVTALERARCAIERTQQDPDFFIEKADFFKLRTVTLSYRLPSQWTGGRTATLTLAGRNLFKITDYTGIDPEVSDLGDSGLNGLARREYYQLPPMRTFLASLRFNF
jgi:TonB-dependent SusC/RagA subfamily outer membrane receptor